MFGKGIGRGKVKGIGLLNDLSPFQIIRLSDGGTDKTALVGIEGMQAKINQVLVQTSLELNFNPGCLFYSSSSSGSLLQENANIIPA